MSEPSNKLSANTKTLTKKIYDLAAAKAGIFGFMYKENK